MRLPRDDETLDMECRCCGKRTVRIVLDLGDQPNANRLIKPGAGPEPRYPLRFGRCDDCTLMQIDHTIPRDDMFRDYVYVSGTTVTLARHFEKTTAKLRQLYDIRSDDLVVDIGSNDGTWLKTWGNNARVLGVEPSHNVSTMAAEAGVPTINAYFDLDTARSIRSNFGPARLITSAGSFFHMEDLHGACEGIRELLAPGGAFVCQAISGRDMIDGNAFDQILHEHLCYYTVPSFYELMARHGMQLVHCEHHAIHGGTNEYHVVRRAPHLTSDATVFHPGVGVSLADCREFAARVLSLRTGLLRELLAYRAAGKSVWAYGAPGKGGTLLNSFRIGPDLVRCATERNPLKFGLQIPGCRIPIVRETEEKPDVFLVLAWNFLDEFMAKERAWLAGGGEFLVPVPDVRVVKRPQDHGMQVGPTCP